MSKDIILTAILTSSTTTGFILLFIKRFIESEFRLREKRRILRYEIEGKVKQEILASSSEKELSIYVEIVEVVSQLMSIIKAKKDIDFSSGWGTDFILLLDQYKKQIYTYIIFLPKEAFQELHDFKNYVDEIYSVLHSYNQKEPFDENFKKEMDTALKALPDIQKNADQIVLRAKNKYSSLTEI